MGKPTMPQRNEKPTLLLGAKTRRHRNIFQCQFAVLKVEVGLGRRKHYGHLRASDIVGNEAQYYSVEPIPGKETMRSQKDLVYAISVNPAIDDSPSRKLF